MYRKFLPIIVKSYFLKTTLAVLMGIIVGSIILLFSGFNPINAYLVMLRGVFSKPKYIVQTIIMATPIIITGISVSFAFKSGLFNIGLEGQFIIGGIVGSYVGYHVPMQAIIHPIFVMLTAMLFSALYGALVGFLKTRFNISEVLSSIMLNWIALYLNNIYIMAPGIKKPSAEASYEVLDTAFINVLYNYKNSKEGIDFISKSDFLTEVLLKTDINYGIIIAIIAAIVVWYIIFKTQLGYSIRAVGSNVIAARHSGINVSRRIILAMGISGGLAGLASAVYMTGMSPHRAISLSAHENYGFNGLSVALIAGSNPVMCIVSGLLFAMLKFGSSSLQAALGVPSEIISIIVGVIIFFTGLPSLLIMLDNSLKKRRKRRLSL